jgi:hypothetical protein
VTDTIVQASPGPQWNLKKLKTLQEMKTMSYPVTWKSILTTLATSGVVIVVLSLVAVGLMKLPVMAAIQLVLPIMILVILLAVDDPFQCVNTIHTLKRFGGGGLHYTLR